MDSALSAAFTVSVGSFDCLRVIALGSGVFVDGIICRHSNVLPVISNTPPNVSKIDCLKRQPEFNRTYLRFILFGFQDQIANQQPGKHQQYANQ